MLEETNKGLTRKRSKQSAKKDKSSFIIRHVIDNDLHYWSIVDILYALDVTEASSSYWSKMKRRTPKEDRGFYEAVGKAKYFPLIAQDGKTRDTECFEEETLLRILQSVPGQSQKLEDIKLLLAELGAAHIHQPQTPDEAIEAKKQSYIDQGYDAEWAMTRAQGEIIRNTLTEIQGARGAQGQDYAVLTSIMMRKVFGMTVQTYKTFKQLPKSTNLRDHMSRGALGVTAYTEALIGELHETRDTYGIAGLTADVEDASAEGLSARLNAERLLGRPIDTPQNFLHLTSGRKRPRRLESKNSSANEEQSLLPSIFTRSQQLSDDQNNTTDDIQEQ